MWSPGQSPRAHNAVPHSDALCVPPALHPVHLLPKLASHHGVHVGCLPTRPQKTCPFNLLHLCRPRYLPSRRLRLHLAAQLLQLPRQVVLLATQGAGIGLRAGRA